jgi:hypothetical protein
MRKVDRTEAENYCKSKNLKHIEVSAKNGDHVSEAFQETSQLLTKRFPQ